MRVPIDPQSHQHLVLLVFLILTILKKYIVVSHCLFFFLIMIFFPDGIWCEVSFSVFVCHVCIFFEEESVQGWIILKSNYFLMVILKVFYMFGQAVIHMSFSNILFQSVVCLIPLKMTFQRSFKFSWDPVCQLFLTCITHFTLNSRLCSVVYSKFIVMLLPLGVWLIFS